jgi:2-aminoadipate transaminase
LKRRHQLVELLDEKGPCVVEDDPYAELRFAGNPLPSLFHLDAQRCSSTEAGKASALARQDGTLRGNVAFVGSFSKILSPGLRVGWVIGPSQLLEKLVQAKQTADLHTSSLTQTIVLELVRDGFLDVLIPKLRAVYRDRRDAMLDALQRWCPADLSWTRPEGGMFLFATLPLPYDATDLLHLALERQVAFVPGESFHLHGAGRNTFRLNYSHSSCERIEEGIRRLGTTLDQFLTNRSGKRAATLVD